MEVLRQTQPSTTEPKETPPVTEEAKPAEATEEQKPEEKDEGKKEGEGDDENGPVTFEALQLPEGFDTKDPLAGRFLEVVNKEGSQKERAQALIDLHKDIVAQFTADSEKAFLDMQTEWQDSLVEEHGEAKLNQKLGKVASVMDAYDAAMRAANPTADKEFGQELREAMTLTGAGNNPAVVNFLSWIAETQGEGSPLIGTPAGGAERSRAERMFGNSMSS